MALYRTIRNLKLIHICRFHANICLPGLTQVRNAWYKPNYVEPVVDKELYKDGNLPVDVSVPVKAAPQYVSSTILYDPLISKFVNVMMLRGQKKTSEEIMTKAFALIKMKQLEKYHKAPESERSNIETDPVKIFYQAIENIKPIMGLSSISRGGKTYQVPTPLTPQRQRFMAMKWILMECNARPRKQYTHILLAQEFTDAFNNTEMVAKTYAESADNFYHMLLQMMWSRIDTQGKAVKRKQDLHKLCEANKAFASFRWWDSA